MKREQIYEFPAASPLTPARRKLVEKQIDKIGEASGKPYGYAWQEGEQAVLRISVDPVLLEISFGQSEIKVLGTAPLWARVMFNKKRRHEMQEQIEDVLRAAKLTPSESKQPPKKAPTPRAKKAVKMKSGVAQRKLA